MAKSSFIGIEVKKGEAYRAARFAQVGLGAPSKLADPSEYFTRYGSPGEDVTRMPCALLNRNLTNLVKDAEAVKGKLKANKKFYSEASKLTYDALSGLPGDIITSRDFWRYLAVDVLFDVVYWKYPNDNGDRWGTNPSQFNRSMPLALFIRGQIASACTKEELSYLDAVNDIDSGRAMLLR